MAGAILGPLFVRLVSSNEELRQVALIYIFAHTYVATADLLSAIAVSK